MLVVPELEQELAIRAATKATQRELRMLRIARADLDNQIQRLEWAFKQVRCNQSLSLLVHPGWLSMLKRPCCYKSNPAGLFRPK